MLFGKILCIREQTAVCAPQPSVKNAEFLNRIFHIIKTYKNMKKIKEQKQKLITIQVKTLPNGYSLDLEKENFMYYSPMTLLEGLFVHVGMNREGAMTKEEIKSLIESVKNGGIVTKLQAEVNALNDTIAELRKQVREQKKVIKELSKEV